MTLVDSIKNLLPFLDETGVYLLLAVCAFLVLSLVSYLLPQPWKRLQQGLGLTDTPVWIVGPLAVLYALLFLILTAGLFVLIWQVIAANSQGKPTSQEQFLFFVLRLAGLTTVLGAVIALPVTLNRLRLTALQTKVAEEGLITDRIHKAVEQLGHADRSVRMGALYQLERIMQDSSVDRTMVLQTINAYVKFYQQRSETDPAQGTDLEIDLQAALEILLRSR